MNLQVIDALGIRVKTFALGTAQGGWVTVRMALLAPEKVGDTVASTLGNEDYLKPGVPFQITGAIPLGTSMDYESERSRRLGCLDAIAITTPFLEQWTRRVPHRCRSRGAEVY